MIVLPPFSHRLVELVLWATVVVELPVNKLVSYFKWKMVTCKKYWMDLLEDAVLIAME